MTEFSEVRGGSLRRRGGKCQGGGLGKVFRYGGKDRGEEHLIVDADDILGVMED
jgi:hypothetical protein